MNNLNAIITIAFRDLIKFLRDRSRIIATFIFPLVFIGALGGSLQSNLGNAVGYNYMTFVFVGVLAQTLFQSTASGIISLIEDRENDFSQEIFVAPISRSSIIIGKIVGESLVALSSSIAILALGLLFGVSFTASQLILLVPTMVAICLFGGAFGIAVLSQLKSQRAANQIFPFVILPQFFLSGVFAPIKHLPWYLLILSRLAPMTYAVDLARSIYYYGTASYERVVLYSPLINIIIIAIFFAIFLSIGTYFFVANERNK